MHSLQKPEGHPTAARPAAYLPYASTTAVVIPGIDMGVPILLSFSCQCGHYPFLFGGGGGGGGGEGAVGGRFGIITLIV